MSIPQTNKFGNSASFSFAQKCKVAEIGSISLVKCTLKLGIYIADLLLMTSTQTCIVARTLKHNYSNKKLQEL